MKSFQGLDSVNLDVLEDATVTRPIRSFVEAFEKCQIKTTCSNHCKAAQEGSFTDDIIGMPSILCNIDGEGSRKTE